MTNSRFDRLKSTFYPFAASPQELISKYVLFTDRTEEENQAFRNYVRELNHTIIPFGVVALGILILITWPSDYFTFKRQEIRSTYLWWRIWNVVGIGIFILSRLYVNIVKKYFIAITFTLVTLNVFLTGFLFSSISGYQEPWFSVIYVLPYGSLIVPFGLLNRVSITVTFPSAYFLGFLINRPFNQLPYPWMQFELLIASVMVSVFLGHTFFSIMRQNYFQSIELEDERKKSDELLHNTLPEPIVERLKNGEDVSDRFDEVTVLFADLVEFTPLADELPPEEVVDLLDGIFSSFDDLTEEYGVEKIKTIGDEYFIAAGVPEPADDHAVRCAEYALAMQEVVNDYTRHDDKPFELRIGMNTGSLVAGVIGNKRFVYDVWGDIVNVGSRMESQGVPGKIQVTPDTKEAIQEQDNQGKFEFVERGKVKIKGKGLLNTYFLKRTAEIKRSD